MVVQLGVKLIYSSPLSVEEAVCVKGRLSFSHVVDGPGQFMGHDRQGFSLAVFFLEFDEEFLSLGMIPPEEDSRFGERPLERRLADCCPRGSRAFAGRFLGTLDETTLGSELLYPREAVDVVDCV